jgi:hypothetical protein
MKNLFIILIVLGLQFSCKPPDPEIVYIPEEMKPYIMFPVGSYWVYEDSATLQTDSFCLNEVLIDTAPSPNGQTDGYITSMYEEVIQYFYNDNANDKIFISFISYKYPDFSLLSAFLQRSI